MLDSRLDPTPDQLEKQNIAEERITVFVDSSVVRRMNLKYFTKDWIVVYILFINFCTGIGKNRKKLRSSTGFKDNHLSNYLRFHKNLI